MPRLYNPQRKTEPVSLADGTTLHFRPKARIYIAPDKMTGIIWQLVKEGRLVNRGGDPRPVPVPSPLPTPPTPPPKPEVKTVTSSNHHQSRASVSNEKPEAAPAKKEEKADKKQLDSRPDAVSPPKGRVEKKSDSADSKPKRSRRKKKKGD